MRVPRLLVRTSVQHPWLTLISWLFWLALCLVGVHRLAIDTSTNSVLDKSNLEAWSFYQQSLATFGGDEVVVVAIEAPRPYDADTFALVREITNRLQSIPGIRRVDSLSTVPLISSTPGSISLLPISIDTSSGDLRDQTNLAQQLAHDPIARRILISDDGRTFAINSFLDRDVGGRFELIVDAIKSQVPPNARISGVPVFRTAINTKTASEIGVFVCLTIIAIGLLLYAIFRSLLAVFIPLLVGAAGSLSLLGVMGFAGEPLSLTTMILPSITLAIGCANVMHVMTQSVGINPSELEGALIPVILPVLLSGLTTTIGFLAISGVPIEAVQATGTYGAVGVIAVLAATLTAVPAALTLHPLPDREMKISRWIEAHVCPTLTHIAVTRYREVLVLWAIVAGVSLFGLSRLRVETDATTWFSRKSELRRSYEEIRSKLSGISPMNVIIESTTHVPITRPEVIGSIARLGAFLESLPEVGRALSVADVLSQLHGELTSEKRSLPASEEGIEQYLLLMDSVDQMRDLISLDRMAANIVLRVDNNGSDDLKRVAREAEAWWARNGPAGYSAKVTGIMYEFARAEDEIAIGQIQGMIFALVIIGVVLVLLFRDWRLAFATIITNSVPILLAFGAMGIFDWPLDAGTVVVGNLAIGIAIDETLHLTNGLRNVELDDSFQMRLLNALKLSVPSILYTTIVITVGFGVLGISQFSFTRDLGVLTAGVMVLCVAADVLLLPSMVLVIKRVRTPLWTAPVGQKVGVVNHPSADSSGSDHGTSNVREERSGR